jgi:two-component system NtrC family response regulator
VVESIRSIVWIGDQQTAVALAADCPTLDLVWERDATTARALDLRDFDALILACEGPKPALDALESLNDLSPLPPILVRLERAGEYISRELCERGASGVFSSDASAGLGSLKAALFGAIDCTRTPAKTRSVPAKQAAQTATSTRIIGNSPEIAEVLTAIGHASRSRVTVLITGETGTGKELLAQEIHEKGSNPRAPFVAVNCAAFPEALLESELFGHKRGAFTGADRDKSGLFEAADGGTLFLDEIGETTRPFQAKLLRVLQEREVRPIGSSRTRRVNVRVIAATNRNLRREASEGSFRADLYYRLAVFPIHVCSLRERPSDILLLADHFLTLYATRENRFRNSLSAESRHLIQSYAWPGNVRELENEIQRALAVSGPGLELTPAQFSDRLFEVLAPVQAVVQPGDSLRETLARVEAWLIRRALESNDGRRATTARRLGITREGLYKKMKRHGIT